MIFILEGNHERTVQFQAAAAILAPELPVRFWRSAHVMMADLVAALEHASIISLDHDLNRFEGDADDPGTGYDVVKLLVELWPCCPLIIHTSNGERGDWMVGELSRTNWRYQRVYPNGDEWIEKAWAPTARHLRGPKVRIGVDAPRAAKVYRLEVFQAIHGGGGQNPPSDNDAGAPVPRTPAPRPPALSVELTVPVDEGDGN